MTSAAGVGFYARSPSRLVNTVSSTVRARAQGLVRWNLAPVYPGMSASRLFVVSTPKCGRTWLRVFLTAYEAYTSGREPGHDIRATEQSLGVMFVHDRWEHAVAPWSTLVLGRCLIPERSRRIAQIVVLVRDPRDAVVSLYFQLARRDAWFTGTMDDMVGDPLLGIRALVETMNGWASEWKESGRAIVIRYEDLVAAPDAGFRKFLRFSLGAVDEEPLRRAVEFSSFERMKKLEAEGFFSDDSMRPRGTDPEASKVRRGVIGGFRDYLSPDGVAVVNRETARLDAWFGYGA